jgi:hypothetical protein
VSQTCHRGRIVSCIAATFIAATACHPAAVGSWPPPLAAIPFAAEQIASQVVAPGVVHRTLKSPTGPWTINILSVALDSCNRAEAVKGADSAAGRFKTTALLAGLAEREHERVVGGVNADFFKLKDGTPTNLLVVNGRMITPPNGRPVLAFDSAGVPHLTPFMLRDGKLAPFHPLNAVGGRPLIVTDSTLDVAVDTAGKGPFGERNPRTAAGIARGGRQLILVAVDGREYQNAGMTLRELGNLMLGLGAHDAINLDGGGSTTMVYADPDSAGRLRIANHPSDKGGERTVGDALAVVHACAN